MNRTPPLISYQNVLADATLMVSNETADGAGSNSVDGLTYDYWVPDAAANIEFQLPEPVEIQCFGVAAHTLASQGASVTLDYWDGAAWVEISRPYIAPVDVSIFDYLDAPVTSDRFRVSVSGGCAVGVLWVGPVMPMARNLYQGHTPVTLAERGETRANMTETGEWRGAASMVKGASLQAAFRNLPGAWVRSTFAPFVTHVNEGGAFFWAWHVDKYPREVAYCWLDSGDLSVSNSGPRDLMSCTIQASAYLDGPPQLPPIVTTTVYPIHDVQAAVAKGGAAESGRFDYVIREQAEALGGAVLAGTLREPVVEIDSGFEQAEALGGEVVAGTRQDIVVNLSAETEQAEALGGAVVAGDLTTVVVSYDSGTEQAEALGGAVISGSLT